MRLKLLSCSRRLVTTAAVDAEEKTKMTKMLMAPATLRESGQRGRRWTSGEDQVTEAEEILDLVAEAASAMAEAGGGRRRQSWWL